ncbi:uncharacterized protein LY89DRAFT_738399 [Mollisia scopiformis]|uniref:Uncharacterized protein n=1 Tax=Mollisia scopiformis TaxID=149040 RepID=A0A194WXC1_MOLSC|nr:uncharacterized protein LY89DRAFT_738399 [Mollisia scopiformis]KUJ12626.1 hypothetical protein LY89DRAFT_738399 [Mollisia scopiformis]
MANATNLRELNLELPTHLDISSHFEPTRLDCMPLGGTPLAFPFAYYPHMKFQPLDVLRVKGYCFDSGADGGDAWTRRPYKQYREGDCRMLDEEGRNIYDQVHPFYADRPEDDGKANLETWLEVMDWSHLHTLELAYPWNTTLEKLKGATLPALTNLSLTVKVGHGNAQPGEVISFITNTSQPLQYLSLEDEQMSASILLFETLVAFPDLAKELRHLSCQDSDKSAGFIRDDLVSKFVLSASQLEELDIRLSSRVNMSIDSTVLEAIVKAPSLRNLTLRFPSPDDESSVQYGEMEQESFEKEDEDRSIKYMNHAKVLVLFKEMRLRKQGVELVEMRLFVNEGRPNRASRFSNHSPALKWKCTIWRGVESCTVRKKSSFY